jgi:Repeat of unknown function (DUF5648)
VQIVKRVTLIAVLALATVGLTGILATNVYAHPSYGPLPCVRSGCHATPPVGDPSLPPTGTMTTIPTSTPDATCAVTVSDVVPTYHGNAVITLTATDKVGGWGVAYIYYTLDAKPTRLATAPVDWTAGMGSMSYATSLTVTAPATGSVAHKIVFWSQDNYGNMEPSTTKTFDVAAGSPAGTMMPVYRFLNLKTGTYFFTADAAEKTRVETTMQSLYRLEGVAYSVNTANPANNVPLYRFFNMLTGTHFFTADAAEKTRVETTMQSTYHFDGIAYYVSSSSANGAVPVYRFFNLQNGTHFFTADPAEKIRVETTMQSLYRLDGVAYYLAP